MIFILFGTAIYGDEDICLFILYIFYVTDGPTWKLIYGFIFMFDITSSWAFLVAFATEYILLGPYI